jgi:hypothetical protein
MVKVVDNGTGVTLLQTANRYTLTSALATCIPVKITLAFGYSTSTKMKAAHALLSKGIAV